MNYSDISGDLNALDRMATDADLRDLKILAGLVVVDSNSTEDLLTIIGEGFGSIPYELQKTIAETLGDLVENLTPNYLPHLPAAGHRA